MESTQSDIDDIAVANKFSGVISIDRAGAIELERAYGFANRSERIPNTPTTRFGIASGAKGFTALVVVSLIADGALQLSTPVRSVLGADLPLIDEAVTVEHLLAHRSGIGDYIDEDTIGSVNDYVMPVPLHQLADTEEYLAVLDGFPMKFAPGSEFSYCNGGYVVLALVAERVSGVPFHDLVRERVTTPAGMTDTEFLRSDELPGGTALGYLDAEGPRTNVLHLPVRGNGDGGIYTTAADIRAFWAALFAGRIVPQAWVGEMVKPRSTSSADSARYGLGFWLAEAGPVARLIGSDAGASFTSMHDPETRVTRTVLSNVSNGAWPMVREVLDAR